MKPAHHTAHGFRNNYAHPHHAGRDFFDMLRDPRWRRSDTTQFALASNDPRWLAGNRSVPTLTWIGHDTFLIQIDGLNILTDPHFFERASPVPFAGPKRVVAPGLALADLPPIDWVLISHNHYDHLDKSSVLALARKHPQAQFHVPLGLARWFREQRILRVAEYDWWQHAKLQGFGLHFVPAQHFSSRSLTDRNATLWGGWVVETPSEQRIYFAGDSGYSADFKDIGARFGAMDLSLLPIAAYEPRWFMAPMHVDPEEAVKIHQDVNSHTSVAMHWGTFRLTPEPLDEPPRRLATALQHAGVAARRFVVMQHGETRKLETLLAAD